MKKLRFSSLTDTLIVILVVAGLFLVLRPFSPQEVEGAFYAVKFVGDDGLRHQLFGDGFACAPIEDLPHDLLCQTTFEAQTLAVRIRYQDDSRRFLSFCAVNYGDKAVDCRPSFGYESQLPFVIVEDDLGISAERFEELQAERPLLQWPESVWMNILTVTAVFLALLIAIWRWLRFRQEQPSQHAIFTILTTILIGLLTYLTLSFGVNILIGIVFDGPNAPYWLASIAAYLGVGGFILWRWRVYQGWQPKFGRILDSLAGGTTFLMLTYFIGLFALLSLGFVD